MPVSHYSSFLPRACGGQGNGILLGWGPVHFIQRNRGMKKNSRDLFVNDAEKRL